MCKTRYAVAILLCAQAAYADLGDHPCPWDLDYRCIRPPRPPRQLGAVSVAPAHDVWCRTDRVCGVAANEPQRRMRK